MKKKKSDSETTLSILDHLRQDIPEPQMPEEEEDLLPTQQPPSPPELPEDEDEDEELELLQGEEPELIF